MASILCEVLILLECLLKNMCKKCALRKERVNVEKSRMSSNGIEQRHIDAIRDFIKHSNNNNLNVNEELT